MKTAEPRSATYTDLWFQRAWFFYRVHHLIVGASFLDDNTRCYTAVGTVETACGPGEADLCYAGSIVVASIRDLQMQKKRMCDRCRKVALARKKV